MLENMKFDLHVHSMLSKSIPFSMHDLNMMIAQAKKRGLNGFALTEHFHAPGYWNNYRLIREHFPYKDGVFRVGPDFYILNGAEVNLGSDGEVLKFFVTPGHQPGGMVIQSRKSKGIFVNDIVGCNLPDTGTSFMFAPPGSDIRLARESMKKFADISADYYFLGHFGIWDNPAENMRRATGHIDWLLEMGAACVAEGKPEEIERRFLEHFLPEAEKLKGIRPQDIYEYISRELLVHLARNYTKYYLESSKKV